MKSNIRFRLAGSSFSDSHKKSMRVLEYEAKTTSPVRGRMLRILSVLIDGVALVLLGIPPMLLSAGYILDHGWMERRWFVALIALVLGYNALDFIGGTLGKRILKLALVPISSAFLQSATAYRRLFLRWVVKNAAVWYLIVTYELIQTDASDAWFMILGMLIHAFYLLSGIDLLIYGRTIWDRIALTHVVERR